MNFSFRSLLFLSLALLTGCTDKVTIQLRSTSPVLALSGWITNKAGADTIFLTSTQNYFETDPNAYISGATMKLKADNGQSEFLKEIQPGKFLISKLRARAGLTYSLTVNYLNDTYTASTLIARSSPRLDSLQFLYKLKGLRIDTAGYYTYLYAQELPGTGDAVRLILYKNGKPANNATDLNILNDRFIDGKYLVQYALQQRTPLVAGDFVRLEAWSLSAENYNFYADLRIQLDNGGIFSRTPVNVRTNLVHSAGSGKAMTGYFGGSLVSSLSGTVH